MIRTIFEADHELFRESARQFIDTEIVPNVLEWEQEGKVNKEMFRNAGRAGLLVMAVPEEHGGGGVDDFRFNAVIVEEMMAADAFASGMCITLHNDVVLPYFLELCTGAQKERWFPGLASGHLMSAIAMTEPGAGSDLAGIQTTAVRDGDTDVVNGSKTFITNGINSDLIVTAVKTDTSQQHSGMSLVVIEDGMEGFPGVGTSTRSASTLRTPQSCSSTRSVCPPRTSWVRRAGRQGADHLWRDDRDHEGDRRPLPRSLTGGAE